MAIPQAVVDALTDMKTDALAVAGAILVALVAVFAFKFLARGLIGGAASYSAMSMVEGLNRKGNHGGTNDGHFSNYRD